jgi:large subunit ribosomal protein L10
LAISRQRKVELVKEYIEHLKESQGIVLADFQGLSMNEMSQIRHAMRPVGGKFQVIKNRLLALALKEAEISIPDEWLIGPTAVGFCYDEVPPVAKALVDAAKESETLRIKGGFMGTSAIGTEQVQAIAQLPSREVLLAQVLGTINAPASQMAGVVANGVRQILNVLQAYVDKLQETEGADVAMEQAAEPA